MSDELDDLKWMMEQLVEKAYSKGVHRAFSVLKELHERSKGRIDIAEFAKLMAEGKEE